MIVSESLYEFPCTEYVRQKYMMSLKQKASFNRVVHMKNKLRSWWTGTWIRRWISGECSNPSQCLVRSLGASVLKSNLHLVL